MMQRMKCERRDATERCRVHAWHLTELLEFNGGDTTSLRCCCCGCTTPRITNHHWRVRQTVRLSVAASTLKASIPRRPIQHSRHEWCDFSEISDRCNRCTCTCILALELGQTHHQNYLFVLLNSTHSLITEDEFTPHVKSVSFPVIQWHDCFQAVSWIISSVARSQLHFEKLHGYWTVWTPSNLIYL